MADNFSSQILRGDLGGALIPDEISQEIIQTLPQSSVLLTRARRVPMSSKKKTQPVLASLPEAYWVSEGGLKQTSKTGWEDVQITAEELAVIVPIPDSVVDDAKINLWDTVKPLIAEAMGKKIDQAGIFGVDKPSTWGNDILAGATAAGTNVASGTGVDLADDIAMIGQKLSEKGFAVNGFASQPGLNWQLARLRDEFDAVYLAIGAHSDKKLGLPGEAALGVESAVKMLRAIGDDELPDLSGQRVCVIGGGNVAMDVARELMRNADDLKERTDIPDNVYEGIKANKAKTLHLFIRRGVAQAKFSVQELREMEKLPGVQLIINEDDFDLDDDTIEEAGKDKLTRQMVEELFAIREMAEDMEDDGDTDFEGNPADRKYYIHFNSAPVEVLGADGKVKAIRVEKTTTSADGKMTRTGEFEEYPVQAVYHAIGYKPASAPGIAYDDRRAHLANANGDGRITTEASGEGAQVRERLYATGWAKRGPVGLIGSTKSDALLIVTNMLEDLSKAAEGGRVAADRDPESIDRLLASRGVKPIDFAGWKKVDAFERAEGAKEGREHKKVIDPEQMRALAHA